MTLFRVNHDKNNPYTITNRFIADDPRLSYKAIGIWYYAFSRKEDWKFYMADLIKRHKDGKESIQSGLKELEEAGYLVRFQKKNDKGLFAGYEWNFFETPKSKEEIQKMFTEAGFPSTVAESTEKQPLTIKEDKTNKENKKSVTEQSSVSKISFVSKDKKTIFLTDTDIYLKISKEKFECKTSEVEYAKDALKKTTAIIYDWWAFIKGTIENLRTKQKSEKIKSCKKQVQTQTYKENSSVKDTKERPKPILVYPWKNQNEFLNGYQSPQTSS